jgi:hypothetical protein
VGQSLSTITPVLLLVAQSLQFVFPLLLCQRVLGLSGIILALASTRSGGAGVLSKPQAYVSVWDVGYHGVMVSDVCWETVSQVST